MTSFKRGLFQPFQPEIAPLSGAQNDPRQRMNGVLSGSQTTIIPAGGFDGSHRGVAAKYPVGLAPKNNPERQLEDMTMDELREATYGLSFGNRLGSNNDPLSWDASAQHFWGNISDGKLLTPLVWQRLAQQAVDRGDFRDFLFCIKHGRVAVRPERILKQTAFHTFLILSAIINAYDNLAENGSHPWNVVLLEAWEKVKPV